MGELESIRVFLAVAEQQSFAGAARQLGLPPASVTRTIASLEDQLGVQLLVRTTRQVALTSAGAVYAARVTPLAEGLADAAQETREAQGITSGLIRVSAPVSFGIQVLPEVLSRFATKYPQTDVALHLSDSFVDIVEEDYDLAIRISGPPGAKSTIWRKISPVTRVLVASSDYLAGHGTPQDPRDLAVHICLGYRADARDEVWDLPKGASRRSHRAAGRFSANNGDVLARLVLNGAGIALLPRFIVADDLTTGRLVQVLPDWSAPEVWLTLYYPPYERLPLKVATFSSFFESYVNKVRPL